MSPAAAVAHEAPHRTLESLLPSATDDEILGLVTPRKNSPREANGDGSRNADVSPASLMLPLHLPSRANDESQASSESQNQSQPRGRDARATNPTAQSGTPTDPPAEIRDALDANPDLRAAWQDAQSYRETFASPEAAKEGAALLADLNRMDALFFSQRAEDHAELARSIAALDPAAFASLAEAIVSVAAADSPSSRAPLHASPISRAAAPVSAPNPANTASQHDTSRRSSSVGAGLPPAPAAEHAPNHTAFPTAGVSPAP
jgi:hypothetical protein